MSDLTLQNTEMAPQISPKDVPNEVEDTDSDSAPQDEPIILELDSSSEEDEHGEEEISAQGYILLSQDVSEAPEGFLQQQTEQPTSSESSQAIDALPMPYVGNDPTQSDQTLELNMQQEQVDLIRQVMSNITLPNSAIPDWAKVIPEDKWKASLVTNIINNKSCQSSDSDPEK